jgi:glycosyltransferase involved in cell wall biosynthesis
VKVIHLNSGRLFGGIERVLITLASCRGLTPRMNSSFAVAAPGRFHQEIRNTGVLVNLLGDVRLRRPRSIVVARARLRALIREQGCDLLICHSPWSYALFARVARRTGARVALWLHDRATGRPVLERMCRNVPADLVICNSRWTASSAHRIQPRSPAHVVYNPVDLPGTTDLDRTSLRRAFGADVDDVVILIACRMEAWKGHDRLLEALSRLKRQPSWTLWIAGDAQRPRERRYRDHLERLAASPAIAQRVRFLGERLDMSSLLASADILCQPNGSPEPFGVVFVEAMLSGLPVITSASGGALEVISPEAGRLVADDRELEAALRELLADAGLRRRLGAAGHEHAEALCAPARVLRQLERILRSATDAAAA